MENDQRDDRLDRLFEAARKAGTYGPNIEFGFETRVLARIRAERESTLPFHLWAWRLIPVFISIIIVLGIWTYAYEPNGTIDLSAMTRIGNEETTLTAFLTGE